MREALHKIRTLSKMVEGRFTSVCSVEEFILRARKEKYVCKIAWKIFVNESPRQES